jgi:hypothetical protein
METSTETKTYSPRYTSQIARDRNVAYVLKYYYTGGGRERKMIEYYYKNYPELASRKFYEEDDDFNTKMAKIKTETKIIKLERKFKMRVVVESSTDEDTSSEKSDE